MSGMEASKSQILLDY